MGIKYIDNDTFSASYEANVKKVYRIALYYTKDHHAAEDIVQNVFLQLDLHRDSVDVDRIDLWIRTTAKYMSLNYNRDIEYEIDFPEEGLLYLMEETEYEESAETAFINNCNREKRRELIKTIYAELERKSPRWHEAMRAICILDRPQEEVAKSMGISIGALRVMLHRAKNWIRKHYHEQLDHLDEI